MGIDYTGLEAILVSFKYVQKKKNALTLGRQGIHIPIGTVDYFLNKYDLNHLTGRYEWGYCEPLLKDWGFENVDSVDVSSYEDASIIHNMNQPIPRNFKEYDFIYDGGTFEHIFNTPQVCENIINMLSIGGIFCSVTCNNNLSGHGIYQFSPEFFLSAFSKRYGMEIQQLYLAQVNSEIHEWIDVNDFNHKNGGRNCSKFDSLREVYIITIIKKITNDRDNLITNSPNQYSYENIEWDQNNPSKIE